MLVAASIVVLAVYGLNWGIDFTGGSLMELEFKQNRPSNQEIKDIVSVLGLGEINVQPTKEKNIILRMRDIDEETHQKVLLTIQQLGEVKELRFESVGPVIGQELKKKAIYSIVIALIAILLFIASAFRKVSFIVKSYKYGLLA
ncbi:unnamed protein product, partial [marine sediment metagenome]